MKKSIAKILGLIALCCFITSCNKKDDPYFYLSIQLPMAIPFELNRAGNKAVIDFWVLPERRNSERGSYILGLRFDRLDGEANIGDIISQTKVPLKVKLFSIKDNAEIPLGFMGAPISPNNVSWEEMGLDGKGGIVHPSNYIYLDLGGKPMEIKEVAGFHLKEYGRYRVYVETTQDNNIFQGKRFDLFVADNNTGK